MWKFLCSYERVQGSSCRLVDSILGGLKVSGSGEELYDRGRADVGREQRNERNERDATADRCTPPTRKISTTLRCGHESATAIM